MPFLMGGKGLLETADDSGTLEATNGSGGQTIIIIDL